MRNLVFLALVSSTALATGAAYAQEGTQNRQTTQEATQQGQQGQQLRAIELVNMPVRTDDNRRTGTVAGVVERGSQQYVVIETDQDRSMVMVELDKLRLRNQQLVVAATDLDDAEDWRDDMQATYTPVPEQERVRLAGMRQQGGQFDQNDDGQYAQNNRNARSGQDAQGAQITVQQQPAQVNVEQQPPQIIVRQAPPTIIVQQPQPEIIVRMPEPQVEVSQNQPQVQIQQPEPEVQTQRAREARVTTQRAQPQVRFERTGDPQVRFQEEQGQPRVRIERMQPGEQQQAYNQRNQQQYGQQDQSGQQFDQSGQQFDQSGQQFDQSGQQYDQQQAYDQQQNQQGQQGQRFDEDRVRQAFEVGEQQPGQQQGEVVARPQQVAASELAGMQVYNSRGEQLGTVDRVLQDPTQRQRHYVLLQTDESFGFEDNQVVLPLERVAMQDNRLVVNGVTEDDLQAMQEDAATLEAYPQAARNEMVNVGGTP
jgi:sporulation protein YlmC with PRC-barrel domain